MTKPKTSDTHTGPFFGVKRTAMKTPKASVTMSATAITTTSARNSVGEYMVADSLG